MKIFFEASIYGRKRFGKNYRLIVEQLLEMGHKVVEYSLGLKEEQAYSLKKLEKQDFFNKVIKIIDNSDLFVVEASYPSLSVGFEISQALERGKSVVVLYSDGDAFRFLQGLKSEKLLVVKYDLKSLKKVLADSIECASEQMDTRFNFFISPKIANYLDWVARKKRTPRAVYLRRLIEKDMKESKLEI